MKRNYSIFLITFSLLIIGCASKPYSSKINKYFIEGIWVFESEINDLYIKDTTSNYKTERPIIFDFQKNNKLTIKNYGLKNKTLNVKWSFKSDTILTIDSLDYKINELNKSKLSLIDFNRADTFWINFKKAKKTKIQYTKNQIENILLSSIWKSADKTHNSEDNNFEFFKNKSMIFRYKMNKNDTIEYLQNENWGVADYKQHFFIYNYSDFFFGKGNWEQINQILKFSHEHFILEDNDNKIFDNNFYRKKSKNRDYINIIGHWVSQNSKEKNYGKFISQKQIKNGDSKLFEGKLNLEINNEFIEFKIGTLNLGKYKWQIGKDNKTLLMEQKYEEDLNRGSFVFIANIISYNENEFKLHLFENQFFTNMKKPRNIIVNKIQTFKRK